MQQMCMEFNLVTFEVDFSGHTEICTVMITL
jgi:hypothetical protein